VRDCLGRTVATRDCSDYNSGCEITISSGVERNICHCGSDWCNGAQLTKFGTSGAGTNGAGNSGAGNNGAGNNRAGNNGAVMTSSVGHVITVFALLINVVIGYLL